MSPFQKARHLLEHGFYVGLRDPDRNTNFPGRFMVAADVNDPAGVDASAGEWCVVGDDLAALVVEAYDSTLWED